MPRMTAKYSSALDIGELHYIGFDRDQETDQNSLYTRLQKSGYYWDSKAKRWEFFEPEDADDPTPLVMLRVWADGEIIEEATNDLIGLIKRSKLPWDLIEKSTVYGCRPPKQREGRVYLKFLPRRKS